MSELRREVLRACGEFKRDNEGYQLVRDPSGPDLVVTIYSGDPENSVEMGSVRVVEAGLLSGGTTVVINDGHDGSFRDYLAKKGIESK